VAATERDRRRPVRPAAAVYLLDRLREDKLIVAFVAEFSRGKSELINAVFFAGYGNRILPSSAGRTTMCPTELQWKEGDKPEIRLLPIESRKTNASITELKRYPDEWQIRPLDTSSAESLQQALAQVGETRMASLAEAEELGFPDRHQRRPRHPPGRQGPGQSLPWRHAIIQFPHRSSAGPGDPRHPGPQRHRRRTRAHPQPAAQRPRGAVHPWRDTGVTQSDLAVWREHVNAGRRQRGRIVALNKIDGLWDGLRTDADIEREIAGQVASVASTLEIDPSQVFPVSAQKGLVAKVNDDAELLERSRLADLERRLSTSSCPPSATSSATTPTATWPTSSAAAAAPPRPPQRPARAAGTHRPARQEPERHRIHDAQGALREGRVRGGLQKYYAVRSVFSNLSNNLFGHLGLDALRDETRRTREAMLDAAFSRGCARP
jgi:hypothetical protein